MIVGLYKVNKMVLVMVGGDFGGKVGVVEIVLNEKKLGVWMFLFF